MVRPSNVADATLRLTPHGGIAAPIAMQKTAPPARCQADGAIPLFLAEEAGGDTGQIIERIAIAVLVERA